MPSNKTKKRKSELKSRSSSKSRSQSKPKHLFNKLSKSLNNNLIRESIPFNEYNEKINYKYLLSSSRSQKEAINYYQNNSSLINGFLRKGYQFFSEFKKTTITNSLSKNNYDTAINELINKVNSIDKLFTKKKSPKTTQNTILYRGTDNMYDGINKGYTSCSKSIEAIFEMNFLKGDTILSENCCINVLIVDENIPYLDLENNNDRWKYQEEVLLPRGLNSEIIEESIINYNSVDFKVYVIRVMLNNNGNVYNIPQLPKDDTVDIEKINFILNEQQLEILNLFKMFIDTEEWTDEKEDIYDILDYIYELKKKGTFTKEDYSKISKKILNALNSAIPEMIESSIVREECKQYLQPVHDKVKKILSTEEQLITSGRFIEVKDC